MSLRREFSWSLNRHVLFHRCRRAYYHHYYGSWGGWSPDSPGAAVSAYALKKLLTIESFVSSLFRDSLSEAFFELRATPFEKLLSDAKGLAFAELRRALDFNRGARERIPAAPSDFIERVYGGMRTVDIRAIAVSMLDALFSNLSRSPLLELLFQVPYLDFIQFRKPGAFQFDGVKIWTAPDFLWRSGGDVLGVNVFAYNPCFKGLWAEKARVDAMFAEEVTSFGGAPRILSLFLHVPEFPLLNYMTTRKEMESLIRSDIDQMLALTKLDTDIRKELFARTSDPSVCARCRFQNICGESEV